MTYTYMPLDPYSRGVWRLHKVLGLEPWIPLAISEMEELFDMKEFGYMTTSKAASVVRKYMNDNYTRDEWGYVPKKTQNQMELTKKLYR